MELKLPILSYTPVLSSLNHTRVPDKNGLSLHPFSGQNGAKNQTLCCGTYQCGLYKGVPAPSYLVQRRRWSQSPRTNFQDPVYSTSFPGFSPTCREGRKEPWERSCRLFTSLLSGGWLWFCNLREFSITEVIIIGSVIRPNKILETQN